MRPSQIVFSCICGALLTFFLIINYLPERDSELPDKVYAPDNYYKSENVIEPPDFKRLYQEHHSNTVAGGACGKEDVPLTGNTKPFKPDSDNGFLWFWALPKDTTTTYSDLLSQGVELSDNKVLYSFDTQVQLIAVADAEIYPRSQYPIGLYPSIEQTKGVHLSYDIILKDQGSAYRVTYMSLEKWWLCDDKSEPDLLVDGDPNKPIFNLGRTLTERSVHTGAVLGTPGRSGIPSSQYDMDKFYLVVQIHHADVDKDTGEVIKAWVPISVDRFYNGLF